MKYKAYPEYKDSGVEWLGEIPNHWQCIRLKHATNLRGDKSIPNASCRYVGMENVESGSGKYLSIENMIPEGLSTSFFKGDVLFGKLRPYLAKSWLADFSGICSSEFLVLVKRKVDSKFLNYFTLTDEFIKQVDSSTYGSKMPRASWEFISIIGVPTPDNHESKAIAKFLDHETAKIDTLIEKQQQLIKLLKEKRQAIISHAVTKGLNPNAPMKDSGVEWLGDVPAHWVVRPLKFMAQIKNGRDYKHVAVNEGEGYPVIGSGGEFTRASDFLFNGSSVLLGRKGTIDKPLYIEGAFWTVDTMYYTDIAKNTLPKYLYYCALTIPFDYYSTNTALPSMTQGDLGNHLLLYPPFEEQREIVCFIEEKTAQIDKLVSKAEQAIELIKERRTALISAAVTGKIDVRTRKDSVEK